VNRDQVPKLIKPLIDPILYPKQMDHALIILGSDFENCVSQKKGIISNIYDYFMNTEPSSDQLVSCLKSAWRKVIKKYHPDKNPTNRELAQEAFPTIETAYKTVKKAYIKTLTFPE
jgi:hypothetical protein